ncbi:epoxide hydrolase B [Colletotrichum liriopes]|uniref:Epoxide hydrolase B n=1 Tax=Colletotrichum liriopes TaxID=708192 RepID=A0AA37LUS2_9PEZI|nr:epoxide hydrolase B [Colletotrichum liriopes]
MDPAQLPQWDFPEGVTSRYVDTSPVGLVFHVIESLPDTKTPGHRPPLVLLLHGFPNLSYDWRFMMPKLAKAGYYAVAFDMRGFGRTHNADFSPINEGSIRPMTAVRDVVTLVHALGYETIHTLVGHDLGSFVASLCAIARGDMIKSLVLMSHPFKGSPQLPFGTGVSPHLASAVPRGVESDEGKEVKADPDIRSSLLKLDPPRKHYKYYNASPQAADEWTHPTGEPMHRFLRGYFHLKSADYGLNKPRPLKSWTAEELAVMPHYYVLRAELSMRENVELDMSVEPATIRDKLGEAPWLTNADLQVYTDEFSRNTFTLSLMWYKVLVSPALSADVLCFAGTKLGVPTKYVSGTSDWGTYQVPGSLDAMENGESVRDDCWKGASLIPGAGHWVNMEKPEESVKEILELAASV